MDDTRSPSPEAGRRLPVVASGTLADQQNEALLSPGGSPNEDKQLEHEEAAHEKRNWVRLSYDCNNKCTFCLDSDAHKGVMRGSDEIKIQIVEGRKRGADRLILSGGEPTMHPRFLEFVRLGRLAGYRKIQTVTNGRMFRYPEFVAKARRNGLDEITFSLHGHTAKLHDALVGVPGAFVEETAGLRAALAADCFIVNIDIVINKQNIRYLPEMLETFIGWGVKEFDLLHIIPFGNAWSDAREHLFYDLDGNLGYLQRAFAFSRKPDIHLWLNRFPPPYAEGFEELIQDPYKLNDEVRGRREELERYLTQGQKLDCREPDRCKYCYLQNLCDTLEGVVGTRQQGEVDVLYCSGPPPAGVLPSAALAHVVATDVQEAAALAAALAPGAIALELDSYDGLEAALGDGGASFSGKRLARCYAASPAALSRLLALEAPFEVATFLTKETEPAVRALGAPPPRLVLAQRNYDRASDNRTHDVDTKAFFASYPFAPPVENVPACIAGRAPRPRPRTLDLAMLGRDGRIDLGSFTARYVADGYYTKALRCRTCSENERCRGVHVNWVRAHGFAALEPLGSAADSNLHEEPAGDPASSSLSTGG